MDPDLLSDISKKTGLSEDDVRCVAEELLAGLHSRLKSASSDYIGTEAPHELGDRAFYHLLGMFEQFSIKYGWDKGSAGQYLGRMPPMDRWKMFRDEVDEFKASDQDS
jgi:hypothetical protein